MKVLIIEDGAPIAQSLVRMVQGLRPGTEIVGITTDIPSSRAMIAAHPDLDLILSDIRIDDGLSFSVFDKVQTEAMVVFTTAYDEYALKAFDYNCIDYLMKPVLREALERALSRSERHLPRADTGAIRSVSDQITRKTADFRRRFFLQRGQDTMICDVSEIGYIYSEKGATRVFLTDGKWGGGTWTALCLSSRKDCSRIGLCASAVKPSSISTSSDRFLQGLGEIPPSPLTNHSRENLS